jgi:hypothetical protein
MLGYIRLELDWTGLDWIVWIGQDQNGQLDWKGWDWIELDSMDWTGSDLIVWIGQDWLIKPS